MADLLPDWTKERAGLFRRDLEGYLAGVQRDMDRLFGDLSGRFQTGMGDAERFVRKFVPSVNIAETDTEITVRAELPGLEAKDVEVSVAEDHITIQGEKKVEKNSKQENIHLMESAYGAFKRVIALPENVDFAKVEAVFKNGVLTVTMPKKPETAKTSKKVEIKSGP